MSKHAESPINAEFTLCGMAYDAGDTEDIEFAEAGEKVTCELCASVIKYCMKFKTARA